MRLALAILLSAFSAAAEVIVVSGTIQAAVDRARPGDTIVIPVGVYREAVKVSTNDLTLSGFPGSVIDGDGLEATVGISFAPSNSSGRIAGAVLRGISIQNFSANCVDLTRTDGLEVRGLRVQNCGEYGINVFLGTNGWLEGNRVSNTGDGGIYVGKSRNVNVYGNNITDSFNGISLENSTNIAVHRNDVSGNSVGILVAVVPGAATKVTSDVLISNNRVTENNRANDVSDPSDDRAGIPAGLGILNLAGDRVTIIGDTVQGNKSGGIAIASLPSSVVKMDPGIDPFPDDNVIRGNTMSGNGYLADHRISPLPGSDLLWDLSGKNNCWSSNTFKSVFPPTLPACR